MVLSPGLLSRSALGYSTTWSPKVPTDTYSFSSGPWLGSGSSELLGLMARSAEQPEKGWLSSWEASTPGLLSSGPECKLPELPSGQGSLPPVAPLGAGATGVPAALVLLLMVGAVLAGVLVGAVPAGTLGDTVPAPAELTGSLDGATLGSTLEDAAPGGFALVGNLEGTVVVNVELAGAAGATVSPDIALLGALEDAALVGTVSLEHTVAFAWTPAPCPAAKPGGEEVPADETDAAGPGKRLALGVERGRGWKETDGDTGPRGGAGLEPEPAVWVLARSVSCS